MATAVIWSLRALALAAFLHPPPALAALSIVATTSDVASLAAAIAGTTAEVQTIVPPGSDPEAFEPRPRDLVKLRSADLVIRVGLGYDFWLDKLVADLGKPDLARGGARSIDASLGIPLLEVRGRSPTLPEDGHAHGAANPHYWLDPANAETITATIAEGIAAIEPAARGEIAANRERFLAALRSRIETWTGVLAAYRGRAVIAYHNSWPYFARRFHLNVIDVIEPKEGVAPSAARLAKLVAAGREAHVAAVLQETYEPTESAQLVAERLGVPLVVLAPSIGSVPEAGDYLALFDHDVGVLARALSTAGR